MPADSLSKRAQLAVGIAEAAGLRVQPRAPGVSSQPGSIGMPGRPVVG